MIPPLKRPIGFSLRALRVPLWPFNFGVLAERRDHDQPPCQCSILRACMKTPVVVGRGSGRASPTAAMILPDGSAEASPYHDRRFHTRSKNLDLHRPAHRIQFRGFSGQVGILLQGIKEAPQRLFLRPPQRMVTRRRFAVRD